MLSFQGSCLCELMHCGSVSSERAVTLMIVVMPQDWTELLYSTAVNFEYRVSLASDARVLKGSICIS